MRYFFIFEILIIFFLFFLLLFLLAGHEFSRLRDKHLDYQSNGHRAEKKTRNRNQKL